jgi:16S rRNA (cytidine1402-2'-O)-methyltransferase
MMKLQEEALAPGLYMVATPIGNLEDLSFRALRVLGAADWIAAEDTRESRKLLEAHGLDTQLHSFHEHSTLRKTEELVARLKKGERGAYISDAGTPGISDPGAELVKAAVAAGVQVFPVPGASAPVALLSASGFSGTAFKFHGFFPREKKEREQVANSAKQEGGIHVFFESPHRFRECLEFLAHHFPQAPLVVGRELTKRFESITRGSCANALELLQNEEPRGEYVLAMDLGEKITAGPDQNAIKTLLTELAEAGASQRVLTRVAMSHGLAKNAAYDLALQIVKS